ncbi:MAG: hypothetical protein ABSB49_06015 [Polyangia bacterium]
MSSARALAGFRTHQSIGGDQQPPPVPSRLAASFHSASGSGNRGDTSTAQLIHSALACLGQDVGNVTAKAELGMVVLDLLERAISPGQHLHRAA